MLSAETKRHIDNARDILVGVAPNPITQIDQITYALIYKFMDDMDQGSIKLGGEPSFFTGNLKKYSWTKLLDSKLGNHEKMELYSEALDAFAEAKQLPELFRSIFKDAFLPYRSPETLGLFLKEINHFDYTHPEELGNAYEYLLSIMSAQGDAGQFRTPRHIIDFIVEVLDPKKDETVLDPACGTGGFLVSTYNHILKQHDGKDDPKGKEKPLTPDERKKLMNNLEGYDIDPTMTRIAQVNMYLHQFKNPKIFQYDTLTSEDRWRDKFDVIMANPPFMTPKGGIRPHSKFSLQSKRSEVLFVDYIINHLKPHGRAGVIVPDGVVTINDKSYKQLRKKLMESGLYAVVSLPSGVFQPYSGVKTSVLFFDSNIAKNKSEIMFIEIKADGFELGATKKPTEKNDLPAAQSDIKQFQFGANPKNANVSYISKEEISNSDQFILSGNRYKIENRNVNISFPIVKIGEVAKLHTGGTPSSTNPAYYGGEIKWLVSGDIHKGQIYDCEGRITELALLESNAKMLPMNSVLIALNGQGKTRGKVAVLRTQAACNQSLVAIETDKKLLNPDFLYYVLKGMYQEIRDINGDEQRGGLNMPLIREIRIPLPPLEVQEKIVTELDSYAAVIEGAKKIVENWRPFVPSDPSNALKKIKDVVSTVTPPKKIPATLYKGKGSFPIIDQSQNPIAGWTDDDLALMTPEEGLIIFGDHTCAVKYVDYPFAQGADGIKILGTGKDVLSKYLYYYLKANPFESSGYKRHFTQFKELEVEIPGIEDQRRIVELIDAEYEAISAASRIWRIYENRIIEAVALIWK